MTMTKTKEPVRCMGCGKVLEAGQEVAHIFLGKLTKSLDMTRARTFGKLHRECFERAMPTSDSVLAEMRRQVSGE